MTGDFHEQFMKPAKQLSTTKRADQGYGELDTQPRNSRGKKDERAPKIKRGQIKEADKSAKQTNSPCRASRGAT